MTFLSGIFFVFLIVMAAVYFAVPLRMRWLVLLVSSLVFYAASGLEMLPFLLAAALIAYAAARRMERIYEADANWIRECAPSREEKRERQLVSKKRSKRILTAALVLLIGMLIYTKAAGRLFSALGSIFAGGTLDWVRVIVPLGISYYTFSAVGYLADVYWKKEKAEQNFGHFLLFLCWFPQILQGPIARHKKLAPQLAEGHAFDYRRVCFGLQLALWGYFKKLVIADRLLIFVNEVFGNFSQYTGVVFIVATLFSSIQLYCDFSGCMDIARGISQIFGIELEKNFDHPFFSKSAAEFWRRWHITLGAWFKDYVYMPLVISPRVIKLAQRVQKVCGKRAGKAVMSIVPLGAVWLLTGLWHGTGYNYIAWGLYWGGIIIFSTVFAQEIKKLNAFLHINTEAESWKIFQMIRTFLLFSLGRLITVPGHLRTTLDVVRNTLRSLDVWSLFDGALYEYGLDRKNFQLALVSIVVVWCVSMLQKQGSVRERIAGYNSVARWMIYYAALFAVIIFGIYGAGYDASAFLYMAY